MHKRSILPRTAIFVSVMFLAALMLVGFAFSNDDAQAVRGAVAVDCSISHRSSYQDLSDIGKLEKAPAKLIDTAPVVKECTYTDEDLDILSRIMYAEVGCSWIPDDVQLKMGSVVLNRVKSDAFPDTIYDVVYQKGQYSPTWNGGINNTPDERTIENARKLLEEGSVLPDNVIFQANFVQGGGIYDTYYDEALGTTTYFCYATN